MTFIGSRTILIFLIACSIWLVVIASRPNTGGTDVSPFRVHLQTASITELELLPGIGPIAAQRIIEYRQTHDVQQPDDLLGVYGIGQSTVDQLRHLVFDKVKQ